MAAKLPSSDTVAIEKSNPTDAEIDDLRLIDLISLVTCDDCYQVEHVQEGAVDQAEGSTKCDITKDDDTTSTNSTSSKSSNEMREDADEFGEDLLNQSFTGLDEIRAEKIVFQKKNKLADVKIPASTSASNLLKMPLNEAFRMFCSKSFIVNEDYILFPYCVKTQGGLLERPLITRVSHVIEQNRESYMPIKEGLQKLDSFLNADTSDKRDPGFASLQHFCLEDQKIELKMQELAPMQTIVHFLVSLIEVFDAMVVESTNAESKYRNLFADFIAILKGNYIFTEQVSTIRYNADVEFPLKEETLVISGRPDIVIKRRRGKAILAVVKSKKYYPMEKTFTEVPDPHGRKPDEGEAATAGEASKMKIKGIMKKSVEKPVRVLHEKLYKDLDGNVCRYMKRDEKKYLDHFLAQVVGEILMCAGGQFNKRAMHWLMQGDEMTKKEVRYGIGQVGFKIFFVTVGLNGNYVSLGKTPYIKVGDTMAHGLDVFCTRPLDLMLAEDRSIIADILYAMFTICG